MEGIRRRLRIFEERLNQREANMCKVLMSKQQRALCRQEICVPGIQGILRDRTCNSMTRTVTLMPFDCLGISRRCSELYRLDGALGLEVEEARSWFNIQLNDLEVIINAVFMLETEPRLSAQH